MIEERDTEVRSERGPLGCTEGPGLTSSLVELRFYNASPHCMLAPFARYFIMG
jgi:hypothetical protein